MAVAGRRRRNGFEEVWRRHYVALRSGVLSGARKVPFRGAAHSLGCVPRCVTPSAFGVMPCGGDRSGLSDASPSTQPSTRSVRHRHLCAIREPARRGALSAHPPPGSPVTERPEVASEPARHDGVVDVAIDECAFPARAMFPGQRWGERVMAPEEADYRDRRWTTVIPDSDAHRCFGPRCATPMEVTKACSSLRCGGRPRFGHRRSVADADRLLDEMGLQVVVFGFQPGALWR